MIYDTIIGKRRLEVFKKVNDNYAVTVDELWEANLDSRFMKSCGFRLDTNRRVWVKTGYDDRGLKL